MAKRWPAADPEEFWGIPEEDAQAEAALRSSFGAPARWQPAARRGDGADAMMEGRPAQGQRATAATWTLPLRRGHLPHAGWGGEERTSF